MFPSQKTVLGLSQAGKNSESVNEVSWNAGRLLVTDYGLVKLVHSVARLNP